MFSRLRIPSEGDERCLEFKSKAVRDTRRAWAGDEKRPCLSFGKRVMAVSSDAEMRESTTK